MFSDPFGWFPNPFFVNAFPILIAAVFLIDYLIPRITTSRSQAGAKNKDQNSYTVISIATLLAVAVGVAIRFLNISIWRGSFQWIGLIVTTLGSILRAWAILRLGRFFSRTVQIESDHQVIRDGPLDSSPGIHRNDLDLHRFYHGDRHMDWCFVYLHHYHGKFVLSHSYRRKSVDRRSRGRISSV